MGTPHIPIEIILSDVQTGAIAVKKEKLEYNSYKKKQARAELGQSQIKLGMSFTSIHLYQNEEQEIKLSKLTAANHYLILSTSSQHCQIPL